MKPCRIFIAYDKEHWRFLNILVNRLSGYKTALSEMGVDLEIWRDTTPQNGQWHQKIMEHISNCDALILLMSNRYFSLSYIVEQEWPAIQERLGHKPIMFFPVLMDDVPWHAYPEIAEVFITPTDATLDAVTNTKPSPKPVESFSEVDQEKLPSAVADIVFRTIRKTMRLSQEPSDHLSAPIRWAEHFVCPKSMSGSVPGYGQECYAFVGRESELKKLHQAMVHPGGAIVTVTGEAGYGKSALVWQWWQERSTADLANTHVLAYTFTGPGISGATTNSVDFFTRALAQFRVESRQGLATSAAASICSETAGQPPEAESERDRARQLVDLIHRSAKERARKFLIILDGIDVLRHEYGPPGGRFDDPGLSSFLALVRAQGLPTGCKIVLTCRFPIELKLLPQSQTDPLEKLRPLYFTPIDLPPLDWERSRELLYAHGITRDVSPKDMDNFLGSNYQYFQGNPLALVLYAGYVSKAHRGNPLLAGVAGQAIMATHEGYSDHWIRQSCEWLSIKYPNALLFLRTLGLVHRPLQEAEYQALYVGLGLPAIYSGPFMAMIGLLENMQLIYGRTSVGRWACHALARDWFAEDFERSEHKLWTIGHEILFSHFSKACPNTLDAGSKDDLEPLYRAVIHGCLAGRFEDAFALYWTRIHCGDTAYSTNWLGNHTRDLSALAGFFQLTEPSTTSKVKAIKVVEWGQPRKDLTDTTRERVSGVAAFCLHSVGMIEYAIVARAAQLAVLGRRLSTAKSYQVDSLIARGRLGNALSVAKEAYDQAHDLGKDSWAEQVEALSRLGAVQHLIGELKQAHDHFQDAENILNKHKPEKWTHTAPPGLYSLPGSRWWDLQLTMARERPELEKIREQVLAVLSWFEQGGHEIGPMGEPITWLLDRPLAKLALGHIAGKLEQGKHQNAEGYFNEAVREIWASGQMDQVPGALLARAEWCRTRQDADKDAAQRDAEAALNIAKNFGLPLYEVDARILLCEIYLDQGHPDQAKSVVQDARAVISRSGYKRAEVRWLLAQARLCLEEHKRGPESHSLDGTLLGEAKEHLNNAAILVESRRQLWHQDVVDKLKKDADAAGVSMLSQGGHQ